jgi:23S rRNA pseudouridine1911/1915/1917 synthase
MEIPIVYEDECLLVVDKPSGIVINRAESVKEETIQDWAEKKYQISNIPGLAARAGKYQKEENSDFYKRAGIVHRLDKETSGLLLIAKNPRAFSHLQAQFKERLVEKKYQALVHGIVVPEKGEIKASVGRLAWNRERFGVIAGGREAVTSYIVLSTFKTKFGNFSLLEVTPHTGRTHQIRIHLKYLGFPVVSDSFYAGRKTARGDKLFCPRLFLHAISLKFRHPETGEYLIVESKLPEDLKKVLESLKSKM